MKTDEIGPSLLAAFARVPDVRSRHGRRYALPALLTLSTAAMLCGARSLYAIAQWGRLQPAEVRRVLGFGAGAMPAATTLHYAFKRLDVVGFEAALQAWRGRSRRWRQGSGSWCSTARRCAVSMVRRYLESAWSPCMRPRPAWCWRKRGVRTREQQTETEEARAQAKQEAELSVAPRLLKRVRPLLRGRVVSGDALYCQRALCRQIHAAGGDYLFAVKANQPSLLEDVRLLFDDPPPGETFRSAHTVDAHGGRVEQRRLRASAALADYLQAAGWVGAGVVLEVQTTVRWPAQPARAPRQEVRYFLSSLPATTPARTALALVRRHWDIENRLHWPRDMTLGEDASQVRSGHAPQVLAAVRNTVVGLLHLHHVPNLAAALRTHAWSPPSLVLSLLGLTPT